MRKRIAKRLRKYALRNGAVILKEGYCLSRAELNRLGLGKRERGYFVDAEFGGNKYCIAWDDPLACYRILVEELNYENAHKEVDNG